MNKKSSNKKVIILDFDGVFYSGKHAFDNIEKQVSKNKQSFLPNVSNEEYLEICKNNPDWCKAIVGADIVNSIYKLKSLYPQHKINVDAFLHWQETNRYHLIIDHSQIVNSMFIKKLCKQYTVYIVSNSSINHIKYYMRVLGINYKWFKKIYSNQFIEQDISKKHYYLEILNKEKCTASNAFVYGDSISSDLNPAKELNINNYLIKNANDVK